MSSLSLGVILGHGVLKELGESGDVTETTRSTLAALAFNLTYQYDNEVELDLMKRLTPSTCETDENNNQSCSFDDTEAGAMFMPTTTYVDDLRYGENPHQRGELLGEDRNGEESVAEEAPLLLGDASCETPMSFNNFVDANAALDLCSELTRGSGRLWHRFPTGEKELWHRFPTGASPDAKHVDERIDDERLTRRNLPHIQKPESTYFVTFRLSEGVGQMAPSERDIVLDACRFWHGRKITLHAIVVMPDHVHMLLTPHEIEPDQWVPLGEILHSVKRYSAQKINEARNRTGRFWQDESFDRIMRNEREFQEKWEYMEANPVTADMMEPSESYRWFWNSDTEFQETEVESHRLETGATEKEKLNTTRRLEADVTEKEKLTATHRLETGATKKEKLTASHRLETDVTGREKLASA